MGSEEMEGIDLFSGLSAREKEQFGPACNRLMAQCFVLKRNERTKADYYFITRRKDVFSQYLGILGYSLEINEAYGVVQLVNREGTNHLNLKLIESIVLLILRILYDEKKRELSLTDVVVNVGDIQEKFLSMHLRDKQIDKVDLMNALRICKRYNLIDTLDRNMAEEESRILIYDSILMAIRVDDIRQSAAMMEKYRQRKRGAAAVEGGVTDERAQSPEAD